MAKQLNIDMNFRANTNSAQTELKKLQQTLNEAINGTINNSSDMKITKEITQATSAAAKLKVALESAVNPQTGNLDLSKFSEQLSKSKTSLKEYSTQLLSLGPAGEKAFMQMANAIASAEVPLRKTGGLLNGLWTTMKNTARWQLSSSALHAFMGAIQGAYGYAQNLNKSLNNIRIVTGQTTDQMASFAAEANKAAKALSTSTTAYTDAALIYYQQGLGNEEVKERTESTIKLANVSRQSAEEVSSQMTAIWNNFDNGGQKLEYYADVITALGANTASSSSEIAEGLSKFASVADTVGLSYDKAAASVATVVAETRQSADVVGTAFKTIFARLEGLNLGETLDDGVTLNKYSSALKKVGVDILDSNKELKNMDTILDELGSKWENIDKGQQVALAQTVAGTRQYTQFISLMDNYDKVQKNENVAEGSEGTLQKQADTYAESWEAAQKRVTASAQGIYQELLNDKFFIGLTNTLSGVLDIVDKFIKSLGGVPGVLGLLGTIATTVFKDQIALSIDNAIHNLSVFTGVAQDKAKQMQTEMAEVITSMNNPAETSTVQQRENEYMLNTLEIAQELGKKKEKLLEEDYEHLKLLSDITAKYGEYAVAAERSVEAADQAQSDAKSNFSDKYVQNQIIQNDNPENTTEVMDTSRQTVDILTEEIQKMVTAAASGEAAVKALNSALNSDEGITTDTYEQVSMNIQKIIDTSGEVPFYLKDLNKAMQEQKEAEEDVAKYTKQYTDEQKKLVDMEKKGTASAKDLKDQREKVKKLNSELEKATTRLQTAEKKTGDEAQKAAKKEKDAADLRTKSSDKAIAMARMAGITKKEEIAAIQAFINTIFNSVKAENDAVVANQNYKKSVEDIKQAIKDTTSEMTSSFGKGLTTTFQGISQISMGISSLKGMIDTLNSSDATFFEKVLSVATSLGMAIPSLITGFKNLGEGFSIVKEGAIKGLEALVAHTSALIAEKAATDGSTVSEEVHEVVKKKGLVTTLAQNLLTLAGIGGKNADTVATEGQTVANIALEASMTPVLIVTLALVAAIGLLVAAAIGLVALFNAIKASSPEEKLKKSEENARNLASAAEEAKNRAEELKNAFNSYHEITDKLNACAKGTQEWRDTLQEVNQQVLDLIEKYPDLAKYVTTDSDGVMKISEEGEKLLTDRANNAASVANAAMVEGNRDVRQKQMDVIKKDIKKKVTGTTISGKDKILSYAEDNVENFVGKSDEQIKAQLQKYIDDQGYVTTSRDMDEWVKGIKELTEAVKKDTEARKAETQAVVSNNLANNEEVQASNNKEDVVKASNKAYDSIIKDKKKELSEYETWGWGKAGIEQIHGANDEAKKVWNEYLEAAGISAGQWKLTDTTGNDDNRVFVYTDENGEEKKKTLEEMTETRATFLALEELGTSAKKITQDFDQLSNSTDKTDQALQGFLTNENFESSTADKASKITNFIKRDDNGNYAKDDKGNYIANADLAKDYLSKKAKALGYDKLDDMAEKYGYENGEKFVEAFTKKAQDVTKAWDDIDLKDMGLSKTEGWAQNLSLAAAKSLSNNFKKIKLGPMGQTAAKEYLEAIGSVLEGLDATEQEAALNSLTAIDWSDYDAFDKMAAVMKQYGKTLDENDPKWMKFIADMRRANSATPDFTSLNENLTSISKILGKIKFGDIISEEDYAKLVAYKEAWKDLFIMQSDGTRKFIGNAEDMKKSTQESIRQAKKDLETRKEVQDNFKKDSSLDGINWEQQASDIRNSYIQNKDKEKDKISDKQIDVLNNKNVRAALTAQGYSNEDVERIVKNYNNNLHETGQIAEDAKNAYANMIQSIGKFSNEAINSKEQQEKLNEELASTATNLNELQTMYNNAEISAEAYDKQLTTLAMSASSLQELKSMQENGMITNEVGEQFGLDNEEYSKALLNLAGNYENCTNEILEYQKALASGSAELISQTQAVLENSIAVGEMSKALDLEAEKVEEQAKELISVNKLSEENYKVGTKIAVLNQSMNKGVSTLVESWSDYKKTLQTAQKGTEDYADAALKTKKALAQLLGITNEDYIPRDFLEIPGVMDLIDKAVKGDEKSINKLGVTMARATIKAKEYKEGMKKLGDNDIAKDLDPTEFTKYQNQVLEGMDTLIEGIENGTIKAGEDISTLMGNTTSSWIESLNQMAYTTGMSVDEMNSLLNELGVEAEVVTKKKTVETTVPEYETTEEVVSDTTGGGFLGLGDKRGTKVTRTSTRIVDYKKVDGEVEVAQINTGKNKGTPPKITYAGRDNVASSALTPKDSSSKKTSGDSSSSDSSKKNTSAAQHDHEVNRYSNEENAVNGLTKELERLGKAKDKAFGASKVQAMEQELKKLKELKQASANYLDAVAGKGNASKIAKAMQNGDDIGKMIAGGKLGGDISSDYRALYSGRDASGKQVEYTVKDSAGNEWLASTNYSLGAFNSMFGTNLSFSLDSFGNLQNKDSMLNLIQNLSNKEKDAYSKLSNPSAESTTEYNKRMAYLQAIKERIEQYGESVDKLTEQSDEYLNYIAQIQEKNAEIITAKMENGINLSQKTMQRIERSLKVLGDNIYKSAEAMQKWYSSTFKDGVSADKQQAQSAITAIEDAKRRVELYQKNPLDENAITPAQAAEIISKSEETLDGVIDDLLKKVEEGSEHYGKTIDYWNAKLEKVNANIENNIKQLDHLQNVLSLIGQSTNYEKLGIILEGEEEAAKSDYISKKAQAQVAKKALEEAEKGMVGLTGKALENYKENVLQKALDDYQAKSEAALTALEDWMTKFNAKIKNNVNRILDETENKLTGEWGSFDALDKAMKRQKSVTEEYLTKTNQLYETNKMMRKLSQDIDKTDSVVAKNKLKAFSDQIKSMQEQEQLSKTDLEIAKARYEVLQAELALEEIKDAKTSVRLQRDNEGNFGYVYTADQNKVSDAEQTLEDKQNALYNLGLQKEQEYGEKIINLRKEWQAEINALTEAWLNGEITDKEEFNNQLADIDAKYRELEITYMGSYITSSNLLNEVGAQGQTESWVSSFDEIITKHRLFNDDSKDELGNYSSDVQNTGSRVKSIAQSTADSIKNQMTILNAQRKVVENEAKVGISQVQNTVNNLTSSVSNLSKEVTRKNGLADAMGTATTKAQNLATAFHSQFNELKDLITKYTDTANSANNYYKTMVGLINVQCAYNRAKNGAESVSWKDGTGASAYSNANSTNSSTTDSSTTNPVTDNTVTNNTTPQYNTTKVDPNHQYHFYTYDAKGNKATFYVSGQYVYKGSHPGEYWWNPGGDWSKRTEVYYKSGGYTGSWDGLDVEENGKLAFLHQKELVLNADDTENMLEAVKLIRQISQQIDLQAISQSSGFQTVATQLFSDRKPLQQEITIHAEFPNAKDHNEIEEAFTNLANKASQYANRY